MADRGIERAAFADTFRPGNGMIAHSQIPVSLSRRVARLVQRGNHTGATRARVALERIPLVLHRPPGRKTLGNAARALCDHDPGVLKLRFGWMAGEARTDQRVHVPIPEIGGIAARTMEGNEASAILDVALQS